MASGLQSMQRLHHQVGADRGQPRSQRLRGVIRRDRNFLLQQNVAGIESGIDAHGGHAGHRLSHGDRPLNWRGPAILGQQRSMQIDVAKWRQIDHPLRNDAAITDDDDRIWLNGRELGAEFFVRFDLIRLD